VEALKLGSSRLFLYLLSSSTSAFTQFPFCSCRYRGKTSFLHYFSADSNGSLFSSTHAGCFRRPPFFFWPLAAETLSKSPPFPLIPGARQQLRFIFSFLPFLIDLFRAPHRRRKIFLHRVSSLNCSRYSRNFALEWASPVYRFFILFSDPQQSTLSSAFSWVCVC